MATRVLVLALLTLAVMVPAAQAGPAPVIYYLKDGPHGPIEDGVLNATTPNATAIEARAIPVAVTDEVPVQFITSANETHPNRLFGPIILLLVLGPDVVHEGNITAHVFLSNASGEREIGNASQKLDFNASELPDPTDWGTPPVSTNPDVILAWLLVNAGPYLLPDYGFYNLGFVNEYLDNDTTVGVRFALTPGNSELPVPSGAAATILYNNATLAPSLLYLPWYEPNPPLPPRPTSTYTPRTTTRASPDASTTDETATQKEKGKGGNGIPGPEVGLLIVVVSALVVAARRRR